MDWSAGGGCQAQKAGLQGWTAKLADWSVRLVDCPVRLVVSRLEDWSAGLVSRACQQSWQTGQCGWWTGQCGWWSAGWRLVSRAGGRCRPCSAHRTRAPWGTACGRPSTAAPPVRTRSTSRTRARPRGSRAPGTRTLKHRTGSREVCSSNGERDLQSQGLIQECRLPVFENCRTMKENE